MVKITRIPVRAAAILAGVSLAASGALAGGGVAVAAGRTSSHLGPRAAALAQILRHGTGLKVPTPGRSSVLDGVFCTSSANCWAVGAYTRSAGSAQLNEVLHWNGKKWTQVSVVSPGGTGTNHFSDLFAVRCNSARDCWAVGDDSKGKAIFSQALHWNGKTWSKVSTPTPGGTLNGDVNELFDVVCTSPASCWASGEYGNQTLGDETILNEILHWNGKTWSLAHPPNPGGTAQNDVQGIDAIRCTSARNCLAIGTYGNLGSTFVLLNEALRWNGSKWSRLKLPSPGGTGTNGDVSELIGLGCASASKCWAAGTYGNISTRTSLNQILRWNGRKWTQAATPNPDGTGTGASNQLSALSCTSATSCWAVGDYGSISGGIGVVLNEALRWNGTKWSQSATPNPAGTADNDLNQLFAIRCSPASRCWAVGEQQKGSGPELNEALRWNGTKWSTG